jgi:hypothetical protein
MNTTVDTIYDQARNLSPEEQLSLLERLAILIRQEINTSTQQSPSSLRSLSGSSLLSLSGLGAKHWQGVDIDAYIKDERAW